MSYRACRYQTIHGISQSPSLGPYLLVYFRCKHVLFTIHGKKNQTVQSRFSQFIFSLGNDSLKNFSEDNSANTNVVIFSDQLFQIIGFPGRLSAKIINPNARINENQNVRACLILDKSPRQWIVPFNLKRSLWRLCLTSSLSA